MGKKEAEAAAALGRARWKGVSKADRAEHASKAVGERYAKMSPEERSAAARNAATKRWEAAKKAKKKKKRT